MTDKRDFPYLAATEELRKKYKEVFSLKEPVKERLCKAVFDKTFAIIAVVLAAPLLAGIAIAMFFDGLIHPEHRGPVLASYMATSKGKNFMKYKFNIAKGSCINKEARKRGDFSAYPSSWEPANFTCVGRFLKKHYLDELPQMFNVLKSDISFVGIRPLALEHYSLDLQMGHPRRQLLKAGIFSQTHVRKGTLDCGNPELDYDYITKYINLPALSLLWLDITIMAKGANMIIVGEKEPKDA
ncbi:sugar transferase [Omnitrophica bacterium]|nr:sugar transferase [Candidatus Omnitrophota bacterium]